MIESPKLGWRLGGLKLVGQLIEQRETVGLPQPNGLFHNLQRHYFVPDFNEDGSAQVAELQLPNESHSAVISAPGTGSPIVRAVFEAALAVLKNAGKFSALLVARDGPAPIKNRHAIALLSIANDCKRDVARWRRRRCVQ